MECYFTRLRNNINLALTRLPLGSEPRSKWEWMAAFFKIACLVRDFNLIDRTLKVDGKTGPRIIILQPEAVTFFKLIGKDRAADEPLLRRSDGTRWNRSHQQRRMAVALERAGLDREGTFYALRHSYISRAIEGEVPLNIIADNCGTSIRMIETTYAKVLAGKRREFIERGAPSLAGNLC
jgi:integrase